MTVIGKNFSYSIYDGIDRVPEKDWDLVKLDDSITMGSDFWRTIENSKITGVDCNYIVFYDHSFPVALIPCCVIKTDLAIFSSQWLKNSLGLIRKFFPRFFMLKILECGSPVTINTPQFVKAEIISTEFFLKQLKIVLTKLSRQKGCLITVVRDFEEGHNNDAFKSGLKQLGYRWVPSLPNTYLDIKWSTIDEYSNSMRSHYRYKLLKRLARSDGKNLKVELVADFSDRSNELCRQWHVVHQNAKELVREVLTPEFYSEFSNNMGENSQVLLFYSNAVLVAHVLLLKDGSTLRWLYVGRNHSQTDNLYFYIVYKTIETAITMGVKKLEMGLTTYPIKQDFGVKLVPINIAIGLTVPFLNPVLEPIYRFLHKSTEYPEKRAFKTLD
jgi:predicted N-acyltransferase